ncbi:hypothetical protein AVEN_175893-1 [Araneus ventricosus]|uniref:Uncharacterized protein n=1 Tax=Araneus ventricosus TaxID=182803 RepID=A0A4Y2EEN8_ARAVE|nr:hypothetical protein AVEN_175893-1 [Araneus ventricosus]
MVVLEKGGAVVKVVPKDGFQHVPQNWQTCWAWRIQYDEDYHSEHSGSLNDSSCNSSSTENEVLIVITGHVLTSPEGGTYYHWREITQTTLFIYPQGKREPAASHPCTGGASPPGEDVGRKMRLSILLLETKIIYLLDAFGDQLVPREHNFN